MYNILWLFVDGVRRYYADDDRSRLKFMDEFAKEAVEFKNVVTSAPSTFMSLSAMASGMPSYFLNRNFNDFKFEKEKIPSITNDLIKKGYKIYSFIMHPSTRESMINIFPHIEKKYWPKGFSHKNWWSNDDILKAVDKTLGIGINQPAFIFVDFNCRNDFQTSDKVKLAFEKFRAAGFSEKNTITILCSDHGYPDPTKETGRPEYYIKNNLSHDLILTDDNIMIPLIIQYPNCKKGMKIETTISNMDIYPSLMDILGFPCNNNIIGKSFIPLTQDDNEDNNKMMSSRYHRTDSRLALQSGRGTSIRNGQYKYVFYHDKIRGGGNEEFFDIINDPLEKNNLIETEDKTIKQTIEIFRKEFASTENQAINYQINYLFGTFKQKYLKSFENYNTVIIIDNTKPLFINMLSEVIKKSFPKLNIHILLVELKDKKNQIINKNFIYVRKNKWEDVNSSDIKAIAVMIKPDVLIVPIIDSPYRNNKKLFKVSRMIKAKKRLFLDCNLAHYRKPFFASQIKKFKATLPFIKQEPEYLVYYVLEYLKSGVKKIIHNWFH